MFLIVLLAAAFVPMAAEARIAARHDRALRAMGAAEPAGDVYRVMQVAYPACFVAMAGEAWARGVVPGAITVAGIVLFALAKGLKYWAIATLGPRWTFRVLVPPRSSRTIAGPYRFLRHPNYLGVAGEIAGMALMARAPIAGVASFVLFGVLMLARIRVEERALGRAR
jgi:methyltransferase